MPKLSRRIESLSPEQKFVLKLYPPSNDQLNSKGQYRLEGTPRQNDPVLRFIKSAIRELEKEQVDIAASEFRIQPLTRSTPIWPLSPLNAQKPTKVYALKVCCQEFPWSIVISIKDRDNVDHLTMDRIMVQPGRGKALVPLRDYLVQHAETRLSPVQAQRLWWKKIGKPFRIMDLPVELRKQILLAALGSHIRPEAVSHHGYATKRVCLGSRRTNPVWAEKNSMFRTLYNYTWVKRGERAKMEELPFPNYSIFLVSRRIRQEALEAGWTGTEKNFHCLDILHDVMSSPNIPLNVTNPLAKITLNFDMSQFFTLFGLTVNPGVALSAPHKAMAALQENINVTELSLVFPNPYLEPDKNPWADFVHSERQWPNFPYIGKDPCWKTTVDWILTAAFPYIKHVPKITLRGAIKSATKQKWVSLFHVEHKKLNGMETYGDQGFDYDTAIQSILREPVSAMPPRCDCRKPCHFEYGAWDIARDWSWRVKKEYALAFESFHKQFDHDNTFDLDVYHEQVKVFLTEEHLAKIEGSSGRVEEEVAFE